jgi:hypothetical protein
MTRWTLYALSIPTLFWLSSIDAALAASIGLKCQKGNANISVAGGSCEKGLGGVISCSNSKGTIRLAFVMMMASQLAVVLREADHARYHGE